VSTELGILLFGFTVFVIAAGATFAKDVIDERKRAKIPPFMREQPRTVLLCQRDCVHKDLPGLGLQCTCTRVLIDEKGNCTQYLSCRVAKNGVI